MSVKFLILFVGLSFCMLAEANAKKYYCYGTSGDVKGSIAGLNGLEDDEVKQRCNKELRYKCLNNCTAIAPLKKKSSFF